MKVEVQVWSSREEFYHSDVFAPIRQYVMDHDDASQRKVLGMQCRNAFEGGQVIVTYPVM